MAHHASALILYLAAAMAMAATVAPPAYWAVEAVWPELAPFRRVFNRCLLVAALALLPLLAAHWKACSPGRLGWRGHPAHVLWGLGIGVFSMVLLGAEGLRTGLLEWEPHLTFPKALGYVATAGLVAVIEETLFRGLLFNALRDALRPRQLAVWAIALSGVFALAHFIKARDPGGAIGWLSGWSTLAGAFGHAVDSFDLMKWLCLWAMGLTLCAAVWKTGSLWLAVGLHAGWVLVIKLTDKLTQAHGELTGIWMGERPEFGLASLLMLVLLGAAIFIWKRKTGDQT